MNNTYTNWLNIEITNNYFKNDQCVILDLLPLDSTRTTIKKAEIRIRQNANAFAFFSGLNTKLYTDITELLSGMDDLFFQLINTDSFFFNYTNLSFIQARDSLYYLNNNDSNQLQKEKYVSDSDIVNTRSLRTSVILPDKNPVQIEIKNDSTNTIFTTEVDGNKIRSFPVDLTAYGSGLYSLWLDGESKESFFATDQKLQSACIGIIQIKMKEIIEQIQARKKVDLTLDFNARLAYWQYQIVTTPGKDIIIKEMSVGDFQGAGFIGPEDKEIVGGLKANTFTSERPLELCEIADTTPILKLSYSSNHSDKIKEKDIKLPVAGISQVILTEKKNEEKEYLSPNIIYV